MSGFIRVKNLNLVRALHSLLPLKKKMNGLVNKYLYGSSPLAIPYDGPYSICTPVTEMNRGTISELILEGTGSQPEKALIHKLKRDLPDNMHFVDIGGNIGSFAWQFASKCQRITVFEPIPRLYSVIENSIAYNGYRNMTVIRKALGDHPDTVRMLDNNNSSVVNGEEGGAVISIPVSTLDIELSAEAKIDFVKIDVEGFELKVLKGATAVLKKHKPKMLVELHPVFIQNYGDRYEEVIDFIEGLGYRIAYYSFLDERRMSAAGRIVNRWRGNPGKYFATKDELYKDVVRKPSLTSYHLYCESH